MDCRTFRDAMCDGLGVTAPGAERAGWAAHLAGCAGCAAFAARQRTLDDQLTAALAAPGLSPSFRPRLRARIRRERRRKWLELAPDVVHVAGCVAVTALCLVLAPLHPSTTLAAGAAGTCLTYLALTTLRDSLEGTD
jgi:anti-sigma factor RsiW